VSPKHRGKGVVGALINAISNYGEQKFNVSASSLFVLEDNHAAIKAYKKLGFILSEYPATMPIQDCWYMTKVADKPTS